MRRSVRTESALALAVAALAGVLLVGIRDVSFGVGYDRIGPRFFPYLVAAGLLLIGAVLAGSALRHRRAALTTDARSYVVSGFRRTMTPRLNARAIVWLGAGLLLNLALFETAGFILAATVQFCLVARAFHSIRPARDVGAGVVLSTLVYILFSRGLGLTLPAGVFGNIF